MEGCSKSKVLSGSDNRVRQRKISPSGEDADQNCDFNSVPINEAVKGNEIPEASDDNVENCSAKDVVVTDANGEVNSILDTHEERPKGSLERQFEGPSQSKGLQDCGELEN